MVGLGTVGRAVARRLVQRWELLGERAGATPVLRRVAVGDLSRPRDVELPQVQLDSNPEALVDDPRVALVVEVMGGVDRASALMDRALRARKPVVTANKAAMAVHGLELAALATQHGVSLRYEAAAGAGIPAVAVLRDSLRGDLVSSLEMIINGTTNIILSRMEREGAGLEAALAEAQRRGVAEADPSADIDGHDAAAKLVLLSRLAFDAAFTTEDVDTVGIRGVEPADIACAAGLRGSVKLVAQATRTRSSVVLTVRPTMVLAGHPLHGVDDADNAVVISSDLAGPVLLRGLGGGGDSTASAVVSDIVATVRAPTEPPPLPRLRPAAADAGALDRSAYIRVRLRDIDEAAQLVVQALEDRGLPVLASQPLAAGAGEAAQLAVVTAPVAGEMLERAIETLDSLAVVAAVVTSMDCVGVA